MYPPARRSDHIDHYFDTAVADPYRWMEDVDSPEVTAWVTAQNALTRSILDPVPGREELRSRLVALTNYERVSAPTVRNGRYVYAHNSGLQNQAVLLWQEGPDGEPQVLLDPNTLSADGTIALAGLSLSNDGRLLAYALAEAGSDWISWRVREIETGRDLPDHLVRSKFSGASWLPDGSGFVYSGYGLPRVTESSAEDRAVRQGTVGGVADAAASQSLKDTQHFHTVFLHTLGTPQSADRTLYSRLDDGELLLGGHVTDDGEYVLLTASKGHTNELHAQRMHPSGEATGPLLAIAAAADARYDPVDTDGSTLWVHTTAEAPNGRVVAIDLEDPARDKWKTVLPETAHALDSVSLVANTFLASYLADAQAMVRLHTRTGEDLGTLDLPGIGTVSGFSGRRTDTESFVSFTNFTTPPTILRLDLAEAGVAAAAGSTNGRPALPQLTAYRAPKLTFDPDDYVSEQVFFVSKDGTRVPMFVTRKRSVALDGQNPTLLYAYGGFNISLLPQFSPTYLLWMERGGIFAQPNLRGGGEYGEAWHEAGTRLKKQNVFDDFIAAAEFLIDRKYTEPARLAIEGGSNGGLLVGAVELQRPELFGAAVAHVGVFDMLRFPQFTIGYAWKPDYGDPVENETEFRALLRYSPLHNTRPGGQYPPTLILTADHDDRVFPAHSFKFTAAMQDALSAAREQVPGLPEASEKMEDGDRRPTLIRVEVRAGHGAGMPLSKRIEQTVDVYQFLARYLGQPR